MTQIKTFFDGLVRELRAERKAMQHFMRDDVDEIHTDIKHLWTSLEQQWEELQAHNAQIQAKAGEAAEDVGEGMRRLADEIRWGYRELRKTLDGDTAHDKTASHPAPTRKSRSRLGSHPSH
jgi:hypothetical protein